MLKIYIKFNFLNHFIDKINANIVNIIELRVAVFSTQIWENRKIDVKIEPINEPIVEKNNNFHIFSQTLSHFNNSDNNGIVWLAKKTGIKNNKNDDIKIDQK